MTPSKAQVQGRGRRDWARIRLAAVAVFLGLCWLALWGRAFQVQILDGDKLSAMAGRQHLASVMASGERGRILDRHGRVLALSVTCGSVFARPLDVEDPARAAAALADILGGSPGDYAKRLGAKSPFVWIARQVGDRQAARIRELDLPGVGLVTEHKRLYPNGHLAGQLLGFIGIDGVGLEGLERSFQSRLAARRISFTAQRDAGGRTLYLDGGHSGGDVPGQDLSLTLDAEIQCVAEQALEKAVIGNNGDWGAALVLEAKSGEILAWAQYPFFNPNAYRSQSPGVWRNRIALDALEPGSTLKPFLVAAAMQERLVDRDSVYFCEMGRHVVSGKTIRDTHDYGDLPVHKILRYSSNIGVSKIASDLGAKRYWSYLDKLGLGRVTGLPLPGEARGILRPASSWYPVDLAAASFGQGVSMTALQMVRAYLCLANDGAMLAPRILVDGDRGTGRQVFDPVVAGQVMSMLRDVVELDGTGTRARIPGMAVAGKTGTAQKADPKGGYGNKFLASFVAFVPAEDPEFLILVMVDEPHPGHYGGVVAAPAARETAMKTLAYLGRLPGAQAVARESKENDHVHGEQVHKAGSVRKAERPAVATQGAGVPDVVGLPLRRALEIFAATGRVPRVRGNGLVVVRQSPPPGGAWPEAEDGCVVWLDYEKGRS